MESKNKEQVMSGSGNPEMKEFFSNDREPLN